MTYAYYALHRLLLLFCSSKKKTFRLKFDMKSKIDFSLRDVLEVKERVLLFRYKVKSIRLE